MLVHERAGSIQTRTLIRQADIVKQVERTESVFCTHVGQSAAVVLYYSRLGAVHAATSLEVSVD